MLGFGILSIVVMLTIAGMIPIFASTDQIMRLGMICVCYYTVLIVPLIKSLADMSPTLYQCIWCPLAMLLWKQIPSAAIENFSLLISCIWPLYFVIEAIHLCG